MTRLGHLFDTTTSCIQRAFNGALDRVFRLVDRVSDRLLNPASKKHRVFIELAALAVWATERGDLQWSVAFPMLLGLGTVVVGSQGMVDYRHGGAPGPGGLPVPAPVSTPGFASLAEPSSSP